MPVSVILDDVTQDQSGYQIVFNDEVLSVEQFDDIAAYANDVISRHAVDVLRAVLVLRWLQSNNLGETIELTSVGGVIISG